MDLEIIKIASNTKNNKILKNHTHSSKMKNSICGDEMQISIVVKDKKITDFGYQCKSCIYCQASVSALSINSLNQSVKSIKDLLSFAQRFFINTNSSIIYSRALKSIDSYACRKINFSICIFTNC